MGCGSCGVRLSVDSRVASVRWRGEEGSWPGWPGLVAAAGPGPGSQPAAAGSALPHWTLDSQGESRDWESEKSTVISSD